MDNTLNTLNMGTWGKGGQRLLAFIKLISNTFQTGTYSFKIIEGPLPFTNRYVEGTPTDSNPRGRG